MGLVKVDPLTEQEYKNVIEAREAVAKAQKTLEDIERQIIFAHDFLKLERRAPNMRWADVDGAFVVLKDTL